MGNPRQCVRSPWAVVGDGRVLVSRTEWPVRCPQFAALTVVSWGVCGRPSAENGKTPFCGARTWDTGQHL